MPEGLVVVDIRRDDDVQRFHGVFAKRSDDLKKILETRLPVMEIHRSENSWRRFHCI